MIDFSNVVICGCLRIWRNMEKRPRIGITMRIDSPTERFYLSRHYSDALEAADGVPIHISLVTRQ